MPKGIRENPPTVTYDLTWSPRRKQYLLTMSHHSARGRHGVRHVQWLKNEMTPEIDENGARLLADAIVACYEGWIF